MIKAREIYIILEDAGYDFTSNEEMKEEKKIKKIIDEKIKNDSMTYYDLEYILIYLVRLIYKKLIVLELI